MIRLATALFRMVLGLYPEAFRDRYGDEMEAFLRDELGESRGVARGWVAARALWRAGLEGTGERLRELRTTRRHGGWTMTGWGREIRMAARTVLRRPGFAAAAVATVAIGIGAATAVFSVVDAVVYRPLPYPSPDRLVALYATFENTGDTPFELSLAEQYDYAEDTRALEALGGWTGAEVTLTGVGPARRLPVVYTWGDLYDVAGIEPLLGRIPLPGETATGAAPVAVISHSFWRTALEGDPGVVGRILELDDRATEVIGVLPRGASLPNARPDLWLPFARSRADIRDRSGHSLSVLARRSPDAALADARGELEEIMERWDRTYAGQHSPGHPGHTLHMADAHEWYFGDLAPTGALLLAAAGLLLLLACANVASLLLARGETRRGEFALRRALGAQRSRVLAGLLTESTLLAALGGALGVGLAALGTRVLLALAPPGLPRLDSVGFDGRVAAFAILATLAAGAVFGSVPAWRGSGARPGGSRGESGPGRDLGRSLSGLVMVQLALAVVMLTGAVLLTRSVGEMLRAESGVRTEGRLTASLSIPATRYGSLEEVQDFWDRVRSRVAALPGVEAVAWARQLPLRDRLRLEGMRRIEDGPDAEPLPVADQVVGPDYFEVAGVPVLQGRGFEPGDVSGAPNVALVNRAAAEAYWPGESPVGRAVKPLWQHDEHGPLTIVGVVEDVRHRGVREELSPEIYLPYTQLAVHEAAWVRSGTLVLRTAGDPTAVAPGLRDAVAALDPAVPVEAVATWTEVARDAVAPERFLALVVLFFAACALAMATLGTFGVMSYSTARRTREIGVRVALGARRGRVVREILGRAGRIATAGVVLGGAASLMAAPVLGRFLYGVSPRDPLTLVAAPLAMTSVALLAAALPASRAAHVQPVEALRED